MLSLLYLRNLLVLILLLTFIVSYGHGRILQKRENCICLLITCNCYQQPQQQQQRIDNTQLTVSSSPPTQLPLQHQQQQMQQQQQQQQQKQPTFFHADRPGIGNTRPIAQQSCMDECMRTCTQSLYYQCERSCLNICTNQQQQQQQQQNQQQRQQTPITSQFEKYLSKTDIHSSPSHYQPYNNELHHEEAYITQPDSEQKFITLDNPTSLSIPAEGITICSSSCAPDCDPACQQAISPSDQFAPLIPTSGEVFTNNQMSKSCNDDSACDQSGNIASFNNLNRNSVIHGRSDRMILRLGDCISLCMPNCNSNCTEHSNTQPIESVISAAPYPAPSVALQPLATLYTASPSPVLYRAQYTTSYPPAPLAAKYSTPSVISYSSVTAVSTADDSFGDEPASRSSETVPLSHIAVVVLPCMQQCQTDCFQQCTGSSEMIQQCRQACAKSCRNKCTAQPSLQNQFSYYR